MSKIKELISTVVSLEGGYVNDPDDLGGETNWGITRKTATKAKYLGNMIDMTEDQAIDIYERLYCVPLKIADILELDVKIAEELLDTGVNCGTSRAARFLQHAINIALNKEVLRVDGFVGPNTIKHFKLALEEHRLSSKCIYKMLNAQQCIHYMHIVESRPKNHKYLFGWLDKRVD